MEKLKTKPPKLSTITCVGMTNYFLTLFSVFICLFLGFAPFLRQNPNPNFRSNLSTENYQPPSSQITDHLLTHQLSNQKVKYRTKHSICSPLLSNQRKLQTQHNLFHNQTAPLFMWHPQKAGGTSLCTMIRNHYTTEGLLFKSPDCNYEPLRKAILLNFSNYQDTYWPERLRYVAMEPSNMEMRTFPIKYRIDQTANVLLNESNPLFPAAWTNSFHIIIIRHPLDLAISALNYHFQGTSGSVWSICQQQNLSLSLCMEEVFRIVDDETGQWANLTSAQSLDRFLHSPDRGDMTRGVPVIPSPHPFFCAQTINIIRNQIFGTYYSNILSLDGSLEAAKSTLSRFHLIVDLTLPSVSSFLLQHVLGWNEISKITHTNSNAQPTHSLLSSLSVGHVERMTHYLKQELLLYGTVH